MIKNLLVLFFMLIGCIASAQKPQVVGGQDPSQTVEFKGKLYFFSWDNVHGRELWSYDGSTQPAIVLDLNPGIGWGTVSGTSRQSMVVYKNKLYFPGNNGTTGAELYAYDGVNPPALAAEITPGSAGCAMLSELMVFGSKLYFTATSPSNGVELYVFDGLVAPKLIDVNLGAADCWPTGITPFGGKLFFCGYWAGAGFELLSYDTVTRQASLVKDINNEIFLCSGPISSAVNSLQVVNNKLYFCAYVDHGAELYEYDGANITRLTDLAPGATNSISPLGGELRVVIYLNGAFYFSGATDGSNYQLYKYNLTGKTTSLVTRINPSGPANPHSFTLYNGKLYFSATNPIGNPELWATDGTSTGLVADIHPTLGSDPTNFYVWRGQLYFRANGPTGTELYRLSTPAGVQQVSMPGSVRIYPNPTRDVAYLDLIPDQELAISIQVTDVTGRIVWTKPLATYQAAKTTIDIPLSNLSTGSYWYHLFSAEGQQFAGGCIIKN